MKIQSPNVIEDLSRRDVSKVHHHVDDREGERTLPDRGISPGGGEQHWSAKRFPHRQGKNAAAQCQRWVGGTHHHSACYRANSDAEKKSAAQTDRVR